MRNISLLSALVVVLILFIVVENNINIATVNIGGPGIIGGVTIVVISLLIEYHIFRKRKKK